MKRRPPGPAGVQHVFHPSLPGYDVQQILHDGCPECERRGASVPQALLALDPANFTRAWIRSYEWGRANGHVSHASEAEKDLLGVLYTIRQQLGLAVRLGLLDLDGKG